MRILFVLIVALVAAYFIDQMYWNGRYSREVAAMLYQIRMAIRHR
jgi:hypothetical protein